MHTLIKEEVIAAANSPCESYQHIYEDLFFDKRNIELLKLWVAECAKQEDESEEPSLELQMGRLLVADDVDAELQSMDLDADSLAEIHPELNYSILDVLAFLGRLDLVQLHAKEHLESPDSSDISLVEMFALGGHVDHLLTIKRDYRAVFDNTDYLEDFLVKSHNHEAIINGIATGLIDPNDPELEEPFWISLMRAGEMRAGESRVLEECITRKWFDPDVPLFDGHNGWYWLTRYGFVRFAEEAILEGKVSYDPDPLTGMTVWHRLAGTAGICGSKSELDYAIDRKLFDPKRTLDWRGHTVWAYYVHGLVIRLEQASTFRRAQIIRAVAQFILERGALIHADFAKLPKESFLIQHMAALIDIGKSDSFIQNEDLIEFSFASIAVEMQLFASKGQRFNLGMYKGLMAEFIRFLSERQLFARIAPLVLQANSLVMRCFFEQEPETLDPLLQIMADDLINEKLSRTAAANIFALLNYATVNRTSKPRFYQSLMLLLSRNQAVLESGTKDSVLFWLQQQLEPSAVTIQHSWRRYREAKERKRSATVATVREGAEDEGHPGVKRPRISSSLSA